MFAIRWVGMLEVNRTLTSLDLGAANLGTGAALSQTGLDEANTSML